MATNYLGGKAEVSLNGVTVPADLLAADGVAATITEGTRDIETLAGTFSQPSGLIEEATLVFSVLLPSMDYLKNIFPGLYKAGTGAQLTGRVEFGGSVCSSRENTPVNVHYTCETTSDNDIHIPNGAVQYSANLTMNASDPVMVEVTVMAQPDDNGVVAWYGAGDLTQPTAWDAATEAFVPVS